MKCLSCSVEINTQWKYAIDQNVCPFCGQLIMEAELKSLFNVLSGAMQKMDKYSDQLNDWMLSNYNFVKTDSPDLIKYVPKELLFTKKVPTKVDESDSVATPRFKRSEINEESEESTVGKLSDERTNEFFARAEAVKSRDEMNSNIDRFKKLKQQIDQDVSGQVSDTGEQYVSDLMGKESLPNIKSVFDNADVFATEEDEYADNSDEYSDEYNDIPPQLLLRMTKGNKGATCTDDKDMASLRNMLKKSQGVQLGRGGFSRR